MHVSGLWRYPVKSLGGEALASAVLTADGIAGDRTVHVQGARVPLTGRTRHGLLTIPAHTGDGGVPRVAGHPGDSTAATDLVRDRAGPDARLVAYGGPERFDIGNLLVATDGAVAAFGHDVRRLRPNLLLGDVPADAEATWPGRAIAIGEALIGVHSVRQRCVVTSIDPDTGEHDLDVFRRIRRRPVLTDR
ncbi:MOSC domain-containing protein [Longispora sp. K20-0274]|uniref:MOSC N-terminal beta barrel domain-containing protein n=1 Tax=Longispora sp. K20-0274 TaxID=3088255 RepID=UPI00399A19D4